MRIIWGKCWLKHASMWYSNIEHCSLIWPIVGINFMHFVTLHMKLYLCFKFDLNSFVVILYWSTTGHKFIILKTYLILFLLSKIYLKIYHWEHTVNSEYLDDKVIELCSSDYTVKSHLKLKNTMTLPSYQQ